MKLWINFQPVVWFLAFAICIGCNSTGETPADSSNNASAVEPEESAPSDVSTNSSAEAETLIIDVRSTEEWDSGHLSQAIHIPHTEIGTQIEAHAASKDAKIALYCRSGGRAGVAKTTLEELGYTNVENVGGYQDAQARFGSE
ncbi:MAG: rhodanese-like domain-containing protein [Planctomycetales bacterium]|nr:rhodanese-like domain-containing protein [Planctomycetales bacterium]